MSCRRPALWTRSSRRSRRTWSAVRLPGRAVAGRSSRLLADDAAARARTPSRARASSTSPSTGPLALARLSVSLATGAAPEMIAARSIVRTANAPRRASESHGSSRRMASDPKAAIRSRNSIRFAAPAAAASRRSALRSSTAPNGTPGAALARCRYDRYPTRSSDSVSIEDLRGCPGSGAQVTGSGSTPVLRAVTSA